MVFSLINLVILQGWTLSKPGQSNIKTHFDGRKLIFLFLPLTCKDSLGIKKKMERSVNDDCCFNSCQCYFFFCSGIASSTMHLHTYTYTTVLSTAHFFPMRNRLKTICLCRSLICSLLSALCSLLSAFASRPFRSLACYNLQAQYNLQQKLGVAMGIGTGIRYTCYNTPYNLSGEGTA